jgi:hypothetical protein
LKTKSAQLPSLVAFPASGKRSPLRGCSSSEKSFRFFRLKTKSAQLPSLVAFPTSGKRSPLRDCSSSEKSFRFFRLKTKTPAKFVRRRASVSQNHY